MLIQDKVDAVFIPDSPSRIKATDYNQIKNEIQECISSAGLTPTKDVIQLPQALKILTAQNGAEEVAKIEAAGAEQVSVISSAGQSQLEAITDAAETERTVISTQGAAVIQQSQAWANKTDGPVEDGEYSAKKYAQDAAAWAQASRDKADTNLTNVAGNIDYIVDSYSDEGGNWWRLWRNGRLEQGGIVSVHYDGSLTSVSLLRPFVNQNYDVLLTMGGVAYNGVANCAWQDKTPTSFNINGDYTNSTAKNVPTTWYACGQGAE